mmetsp:Transcript_16938/g.36452  ORF Transcript_16938/g.36452 Transcript_16938/m.36452 type:complete len:435 (-) Transcript_16938:325-1629(-)|eukprot:CAMPEP_0206489780 /NCGR_PEP_ID=MMETSP0324_2-20121206/43530_1 /ASSEMBLY_ACC=CAM_ASM_000836 /TAXON_ID=2866 /ORGANISM="Crypthecodinium cohnii, Strain Seligo" /LENGTH=434 /DNA_ID=CAMNT_0053969697 /DNA_START=127 /DNA_END=1431 /DNA_ORIENTATION=+
MAPTGIACAILSLLASASATDLSSITYAEFLQRHGQDRSSDHLSYEHRERLFHDQLDVIRRHNANPYASYKLGLNKFTDYTKEEFHALLGHRRIMSGQVSGQAYHAQNRTSGGSSFLQARSRPGHDTNRNSFTDWVEQAATVAVKDQEACGSCWAVAAATAMEMAAKIKTKNEVKPTSFEQLVDCVKNPQSCGGSGGCDGATSELAFAYIKEYGIIPEASYKGYRSRDSNADIECTGLPTGTSALLHAKDFVKLPSNQLQPLMSALVENGPIVVSVDATPWQSYSSGIFNGCNRNAIVNHAVVLTGYGTERPLGAKGERGGDSGFDVLPEDKKTAVLAESTVLLNGLAAIKDYWVIRNSWGPGWGESGNIRLARHGGDSLSQNAEDAGFCGTDTKPQEGVGCKEGPGHVDKMAVCGMCGVLSDSSYPVGVSLAK